MNVRELIEVLRGFPEDMEVELAIVAPLTDEDEVTVDRYPVDHVMQWEGDEAEPEEPLVWLVGGEDEDLEAFMDALEGEGGGEGEGA